jgi:hypothetical protein
MLLRFFFISKRSNGALQIRCKKNEIPFWNVEDGLELELTFDREVLDSEVVLPVIGQTHVEGAVLLLCDI